MGDPPKRIARFAREVFLDNETRAPHADPFESLHVYQRHISVPLALVLLPSLELFENLKKTVPAPRNVSRITTRLLRARSALTASEGVRLHADAALGDGKACGCFFVSDVDHAGFA